MDSAPLTLSLLFLSFWCVNAGPPSNATTPQKEPRLGNVPRIFDGQSTPQKEPRLGNVPRIFDGQSTPQKEPRRHFMDIPDAARQVPLPCGTHDLAPGQTVTIQSQRYPNWYPWFSRCLWTFNGLSADSTISITCHDFRLRGCWLSSVLISGEGLCERYCRIQGPFTETSGNNFMEVKFRSIIRRYYGFSCTVTASGETGVTTVPSTTPPQCLCGRRNPVVRIVGGNPTEVHEYPWRVGLTSASSSRPFCGGSIISDQWILTAAHCVDGFWGNGVSSETRLLHTLQFFGLIPVIMVTHHSSFPPLLF